MWIEPAELVQLDEVRGSSPTPIRTGTALVLAKLEGGFLSLAYWGSLVQVQFGLVQSRVATVQFMNRTNLTKHLVQFGVQPLAQTECLIQLGIHLDGTVAEPFWTSFDCQTLYSIYGLLLIYDNQLFTGAQFINKEILNCSLLESGAIWWLCQWLPSQTSPASLSLALSSLKLLVGMGDGVSCSLWCQEEFYIMSWTTVRRGWIGWIHTPKVRCIPRGEPHLI